jgi:mono/diheme cytochrome c family protein
MTSNVSVSVLLAALAVAAPAAAQDGARLGRVEFNAYCAQCHGTSGKGDGVIAHLLNVPPADLTRIQAENGGVFPFTRVYDIIESGGAIMAHGTPEMPAWGERYTVDAYLLYGFRIDPAERDAFIRGRILALTEYISTLQAP